MDSNTTIATTLESLKNDVEKIVYSANKTPGNFGSSPSSTSSSSSSSSSSTPSPSPSPSPSKQPIDQQLNNQKKDQTLDNDSSLKPQSPEEPKDDQPSQKQEAPNAKNELTINVGGYKYTWDVKIGSYVCWRTIGGRAIPFTYDPKTQQVAEYNQDCSKLSSYNPNAAPEEQTSAISQPSTPNSSAPEVVAEIDADPDEPDQFMKELLEELHEAALEVRAKSVKETPVQNETQNKKEYYDPNTGKTYFLDESEVEKDLASVAENDESASVESPVSESVAQTNSEPVQSTPAASSTQSSPTPVPAERPEPMQTVKGWEVHNYSPTKYDKMKVAWVANNFKHGLSKSLTKLADAKDSSSSTLTDRAVIMSSAANNYLAALMSGHAFHGGLEATRGLGIQSSTPREIRKEVIAKFQKYMDMNPVELRKIATDLVEDYKQTEANFGPDPWTLEAADKLTQKNSFSLLPEENANSPIPAQAPAETEPGSDPESVEATAQQIYNQDELFNSVKKVLAEGKFPPEGTAMYEATVEIASLIKSQRFTNEQTSAFLDKILVSDKGGKVTAGFKRIFDLIQERYDLQDKKQRGVYQQAINDTKNLLKPDINKLANLERFNTNNPIEGLEGKGFNPTLTDQFRNPTKALQEALKNGGIAQVPRQELSIDPERFQYKSQADELTGATNQFDKVTSFNPDLSGILIVWHDPNDGHDYVVNGHHRLELANRLGWSESLPVRFINADSDKIARVIGALQNIADDKGSPYDAAKLLRDSGVTKKRAEEFGINPKGDIFTKGEALRYFPEEIFNELRNYDPKAKKFDSAVAVGSVLQIRKFKGETDEEYAKRLGNVQGKIKTVWRIGKRYKVLNDPQRMRDFALMIKHLQPRTAQGSLLDYDEYPFAEKADLFLAVRRHLMSKKGALGFASSTKRMDAVNDTGIAKVESNKEAAKEAYNQIKDLTSNLSEVIETHSKLSNYFDKIAWEMKNNESDSKKRKRLVAQAVGAFERLYAERGDADIRPGGFAEEGQEIDDTVDERLAEGGKESESSPVDEGLGQGDTVSVQPEVKSESHPEAKSESKPEPSATSAPSENSTAQPAPAPSKSSKSLIPEDDGLDQPAKPAPKELPEVTEEEREQATRELAESVGKPAPTRRPEGPKEYENLNVSDKEREEAALNLFRGKAEEQKAKEAHGDKWTAIKNRQKEGSEARKMAMHISNSPISDFKSARKYAIDSPKTPIKKKNGKDGVRLNKYAPKALKVREASSEFNKEQRDAFVEAAKAHQNYLEAVFTGGDVEQAKGTYNEAVKRFKKVMPDPVPKMGPMPNKPLAYNPLLNPEKEGEELDESDAKSELANELEGEEEKTEEVEESEPELESEPEPEEEPEPTPQALNDELNEKAKAKKEKKVSDKDFQKKIEGLVKKYPLDSFYDTYHIPEFKIAFTSRLSNSSIKQTIRQMCKDYIESIGVSDSRKEQYRETLAHLDTLSADDFGEVERMKQLPSISFALKCGLIETATGADGKEHYVSTELLKDIPRSAPAERAKLMEQVSQSLVKNEPYVSLAERMLKNTPNAKTYGVRFDTNNMLRGLGLQIPDRGKGTRNAKKIARLGGAYIALLAGMSGNPADERLNLPFMARPTASFKGDAIILNPHYQRQAGVEEEQQELPEVAETSEVTNPSESPEVAETPETNEVPEVAENSETVEEQEPESNREPSVEPTTQDLNNELEEKGTTQEPSNIEESVKKNKAVEESDVAKDNAQAFNHEIDKKTKAREEYRAEDLHPERLPFTTLDPQEQRDRLDRIEEKFKTPSRELISKFHIYDRYTKGNIARGIRSIIDCIRKYPVTDFHSAREFVNRCPGGVETGLWKEEFSKILKYFNKDLTEEQRSNLVDCVKAHQDRMVYKFEDLDRELTRLALTDMWASERKFLDSMKGTKKQPKTKQSSQPVPDVSPQPQLAPKNTKAEQAKKTDEFKQEFSQGLHKPAFMNEGRKRDLCDKHLQGDKRKTAYKVAKNISDNPITDMDSVRSYVEGGMKFKLNASTWELSDLIAHASGITREQESCLVDAARAHQDSTLETLEPDHGDRPDRANYSGKYREAIRRFNDLEKAKETPDVKKEAPSTPAEKKPSDQPEQSAASTPQDLNSEIEKKEAPKQDGTASLNESVESREPEEPVQTSLPESVEQPQQSEQVVEQPSSLSPSKEPTPQDLDRELAESKPEKPRKSSQEALFNKGNTPLLDSQSKEEPKPQEVSESDAKAALNEEIGDDEGNSAENLSPINYTLSDFDLTRTTRAKNDEQKEEDCKLLVFARRTDNPKEKMKAYDVLFRRYYSFVKAAIKGRLKTKDQDLCDDLAQDVFHTLLKKEGEGEKVFDPSKGNVEQYLSKSAQYKVLQWFNEKKKNGISESSLGVDHQDDDAFSPIAMKADKNLSASQQEQISEVEKQVREYVVRNFLENNEIGENIKKYFRYYLDGNSSPDEADERLVPSTFAQEVLGYDNEKARAFGKKMQAIFERLENKGVELRQLYNNLYNIRNLGRVNKSKEDRKKSRRDYKGRYSRLEGELNDFLNGRCLIPNDNISQLQQELIALC